MSIEMFGNTSPSVRFLKPTTHSHDVMDDNHTHSVMVVKLIRGVMANNHMDQNLLT